MKNNFENLPKQMKDEGFFCTHYKKTPTNKTKPNQKETFRSYEETMKLKKDYEGIGIGIFDSFCGIDIDHCINDKGEMTELAKDIIKRIKSYTEKSLSGTGIHIVFKCNNQKQFDSMKYYTKMNEKQLQENGFNGTGGLELYQGQFDNRYLTLTGNTLINDLKTIDSEVIEGIVEDYMKKPQIQKKSDTNRDTSGNYQDDLQFLNTGLKQGSKLIELWNSTPSGSGGDESETDLKLLCQLAYWTNCNESLMIQSFESSPYFMQKDDKHKNKWNREDYQSDTIKKAIDSVSQTARENNEIFQEKMREKEAERMKQEQEKQALEQQKEEQKREETRQLMTSHNAMNIIDSFFETIDSGIYKPCPTGFTKLDEKTNGGISNQSLVILGGGTSVGKTTFALNLMSNFAKTRPIVYYTLEMSEEQILSKLYSHLAFKTNGMKVSNSNILQSYDKNKMTEYQRSKLLEAIREHEELKNIFVRFPESSNIDFLMNEIVQITKELKEQEQLAPIIVIDYLQFIQGGQKEDIQSLIKRIQRNLKKYAIEENTIVFLLSANSREANRRKESDIDSGRDTSDIEYTSDYNMQLNFYEYEHRKNTKASVKELSRVNPKKMTITIHKQRFGERGLMIDYYFNGISNTFEEIQEESPLYDDEEEIEETPKRKLNKLSDM
jgi:replicative DNA helicase